MFFGIVALVVAIGLWLLWRAMRPAKPVEPEHDDLRRADDGDDEDPGKGLGSASYWPTA